jgi:hypothetical protein
LDNTVPGFNRLIACEGGDDFVHYHYFRAFVGRGELGYELQRHDGMPVHYFLRPLDFSRTNFVGRYSHSCSMGENPFRQVRDRHWVRAPNRRSTSSLAKYVKLIPQHPYRGCRLGNKAFKFRW